MHDTVGHGEYASSSIDSLARVRSLVLLARVGDRQHTVGGHQDSGAARVVLRRLDGGRSPRRIADAAPVEPPDDQRRRNADSRALDRDRLALLDRQLVHGRSRNRRHR